MEKSLEKYSKKRPEEIQFKLEAHYHHLYEESKEQTTPSNHEDIKLTEKESASPVKLNPSSFPDDPFDYVELAKAGLKKADRKRVVAIIGAGASGLVAAMELLKAGHVPVVFESSERIGGRLFTVRDFEDPAVYAEMGSMRVPPVHKTLMYYLKKFEIETRQFPNPNNIQTCYYVNGKKEFGSPANQVEWVQALYTKWDEAIRPFAEKMNEVWEDLELRTKTWKELADKYGNKSFRDFLLEEKWTLKEIEAFATVGFGVGGYGPLLPISFLEILRINVCRWDDDQMEIVGGNDMLAKGFYEEKVDTGDGMFSLRDLDLVHLDTKVTSIGRDDDEGKLIITLNNNDSFSCDDIIITSQLRALQMEIDVRKDLLSHDKWQAIYNTHYMSSAKIFLETDSVFWKENNSEITTTISDLPIRGTYFFEFDDTDSGLICSSYTWEDDARKWHGSRINERVERSIELLEEVYGEGSIRPHVVSGYGFSWEEMPGYRGGFKQYYPGQHHYYDALVKSENNIHFAGDSVSFAGGWIEGALQAGLRAAKEISEK